jgi:hypothetical protein
MRAIRLFVLLTCGVFVSAVVSAQSLGDVAKKEEERRKQAPTGKVYTNKDLGAVPPSSAVPPPPAAEGAGKPAEGAPVKDVKDSKGKDDKDKDQDKDKDKDKSERGQAYWQGRRKELQAALDHDASFADALQSRINALTTEFVNRDNPVQRSAIEKDRQKALADLERLKKQVADGKKAIADLEEEARRAGVPPGWLR